MEQKVDALQSYRPLDVEQQEEPLLSRPPTSKRQKYINIGIWSCIGVTMVVLIILVATVGKGGRGSSSGDVSPAPPPLVVPPGGIKGCDGSEALCVVADPQPNLDHDYRGHPRKVVGDKGVVASDQSRCADIGAAVLQEGGSAVDAAVATCLCQGVVNPFASGVGGGHFALIRLANGSTEFINAREVAPAAATYDMFNGNKSSLYGGLAVAVPLELKGLELAWLRHGRLPWSRLVQPAADIARHGFAAHPAYVDVVSGPNVLHRLKVNSLMNDAFLIRDRNSSLRPPKVGELCCKRPALAATLEGIARDGVSYLYGNEQRLRRLAGEIQAEGGVVTVEDLKSAQPRISHPLRLTLPANGDVPALELLTPPPPSSGAVLGLALSLVLGYGADQGGSLRELYGKDPALAAHRTVEAMKHAFAVRMALGDPGPEYDLDLSSTTTNASALAASRFANVSAVLADLQNATWVDMLRAATSDSGVLPIEAYGGRWNPTIVGASPDDHGTTHIAIVDDDGNAVSMTSSINAAFGAYVLSKSTGILLNNHMDDFSLPGKANYYNLQPAEVNYIGPGKRPLSSMSPSILLQGGALRMVVGASNGPRIITGIMQSVLRILYEGMEPLKAVGTGRMHHQWQPNQILVENYTAWQTPLRNDPAIVASLQDKGNNISYIMSQLGDVQAILYEAATGRAIAVCDPRKDGAPALAVPPPGPVADGKAAGRR